VRLLALRPLLAHCASLGDSEDDCGEADGMYIGRGNRSSRRKPGPGPLLSITKSHMTRPGFEPGPPRWKPATNRLSYGAALLSTLQVPNVEKFDLQKHLHTSDIIRRVLEFYARARQSGNIRRKQSPTLEDLRDFIYY
jgi:hypothetical protein